VPALSIRGVTLDYSIYSVRAQSLRSAVTNMAVGGRLLRGPSDVTVVRALNNVSFKLSEGDRLGLVGHNGSGKTSLLKVLAGIYEPTRGEVHVDGRVMSMIAMGAGLDAEATGIQNIRNLALMQMMSNREIERRMPAIIDFCELGAFIHMPFKTYSAGMQSRLVFAVATELDMDILIMDEWIGAGDAQFMKKASERLTGRVQQAGIVVVATHDENLVRNVCNKVGVMEGGQLTYFGPVSEWNKAAA
jgi:lipopolysaccharide transport system ATP-binding protein